MASLNIYMKHKSNPSDGGEIVETRSTIGGWDEIPFEQQRIEVESANEDPDTTSIKVELLVVVDEDYGDGTFDSLNNSFYFECNDEWITVMRNRNLITLVIQNNFSNEGRMGMVSFYHNVSNIKYVDDVAVENTINLSVIQAAHEYSVEVEGINGDVVLESLPNGSEVKEFTVKCVGGREDFKVKRVKKYHRLIIKENAESEQQEFIKPVVYDNAFQIEYTFDDETQKRKGFKIINYGNINCNYTEKCVVASKIVYPLEVKDCHPRNSSIRQLIVNDYYYEVSVYHVDCIDATDTFIVKYDSGEEEKIPTTPTKKVTINARPPYQETFMPLVDYTEGLIEEMIECYNNGDMDCYNDLMGELEYLLETYRNEDENGENNQEECSITCNPNELVFGHERETLTIQVDTIPIDSAVHAKDYADFIESCVIIGHEIRVTIKSNPYTTSRECVIYLTNAMCTSATTKILVRQNGKPDTTR